LWRPPLQPLRAGRKIRINIRRSNPTRSSSNSNNNIRSNNIHNRNTRNSSIRRRNSIRHRANTLLRDNILHKGSTRRRVNIRLKGSIRPANTRRRATRPKAIHHSLHFSGLSSSINWCPESRFIRMVF
jgi:hypothetical protein